LQTELHHKRPDFSKWAVVAHKDDTGFGRQAEDMRAVLGIPKQIVIPSERLADKALDPSCEIMLAPAASKEEVRNALAGLQGVVFYERHSWHPLLLPVARELGVRTVCVPNWEWFNGRDTNWDYCDLFVTSSNFALDVVRRQGRKNVVHLPWTLDIARFPGRIVRGCGRVFIHNAGLVDPDDRKSTADTICAFKKVKREDIRLIVRLQRGAKLPSLDERITLEVGNLPNPATLYATGDVAIQPSKMEGNGFMVLEPVCSGLPVITLDYPPMSEFVRQPEMLARKRWFKRRAFSTTWVKHAHLRLPDVNDLARRIEWCASNDLTNISQSNRAWAEQNFEREAVQRQWSEAIGKLMSAKSDGPEN
jgi:glycosyltransferase involved in cell wall biosynthesis